MAAEDSKAKEWPTYVEYEKMSKAAEDYRNSIDWAKAGAKIAEIQAKMTKDGQDIAAYAQTISKASIEWNKQWMNDEPDEKGNIDPDTAFFKELMNTGDATTKYSKEIGALYTKMNAEAKDYDEYCKVAEELLKVEKDFHGKTLKRWEDWNPKKMDFQDMKAFTVNNTKKILAQKEKTYEIQLVQGKMRHEVMKTPTKVPEWLAKQNEIQAELTALDAKYKFEPSAENLSAALLAWKTFSNSILNNPKSLSLDISVEAYEKSVKQSATLSGYEDHKNILIKAHELWEKTLSTKKPQLHPYSLFITQEVMLYNTTHKDPHGQRKRECEIVYNDLCNFMEKMSKGTLLTHDEKKYAKFLLVWRWQGPPSDGGKDYYFLLQKKATNVMNILRKPLDIEYSKLEKKDSPLIKMKLNDKVKCDSNIKSQRELLSHAWNKWFTEEDISLTDEQIKSIKSNYKEWGFNYFGTQKSIEKKENSGDKIDYDKELNEFFTSMEQVTSQTYIKYLSSDKVVLDIINQVAYKVDKIFQPKMVKLFELNREKLKYSLNNNDIKNKAVGVFAGPIKTKARQIIKCTTDYKNDPVPKSGSVLDDVRCAIVVEDDIELVSLFQLICNDEKNGYKGRIYRAKNAFSDVKKNSFGYRAVLMNVIETYQVKDSSGKLIDFPLIVEIQLILKSYFEIRKTMHLGYSIVRADDPHGLSRDACKVGVLDL